MNELIRLIKVKNAEEWILITLEAWSLKGHGGGGWTRKATSVGHEKLMNQNRAEVSSLYSRPTNEN